MRGISSVRLAGAYSPALQDHRAVQVWLSRGLALIPLTARGGAGGVAVFEIKGKAVSFKTLLEHPEASRSLYIGIEIYTASPNRVKAFDADSFKQVAAKGLLRGRDLEKGCGAVVFRAYAVMQRFSSYSSGGTTSTVGDHQPLKVVKVERVFIYSRLQSRSRR